MQETNSPTSTAQVDIGDLLEKLYAETRRANTALAAKDTFAIKRREDYFQMLANSVQVNPFYEALYQTFYDCKRDFALQVDQRRAPWDPTLPERDRQLDEMLANENVIPHRAHANIAPLASLNRSATGGRRNRRQQCSMSLAENEEYAQQLKRLNDQCTQLLNNASGCYNEMIPRIQSTLHYHCYIRPVGFDDVQSMLLNCGRKFDNFRLQVKLGTCQAALAKRSKLAANCNKKRNFSKESIALLNDYYFAHMDKPYPSDDVKLALAAQTGLTVSQITNWFGNKRIRHRQKIKLERQQMQLDTDQGAEEWKEEKENEDDDASRPSNESADFDVPENNIVS